MSEYSRSKDFFRISKEMYQIAHASAYSIECMEGHGAVGRTVAYIGSVIKGDIIFDYYKDSAGAFWHGNRAIVDGEIVSMDVYIFGKEIKERRHSRRK